MSAKHPIVAITGSSGAGTTTVMWTFQQIFRREKIVKAAIEGDAFHRFDRTKCATDEGGARKGNEHFSHFGPDSNLFEELEATFRSYGASGTGRTRANTCMTRRRRTLRQKPGTFTPWEDLPAGTDLLFYEGLHGGVKTETVDIAGQVDLLVGVVPIINLEWIQKLHRDKRGRGHSHEAVVDTILRRMPDYVNYICPQFAQTT
jgi:phosphoribulokinase